MKVTFSRALAYFACVCFVFVSASDKTAAAQNVLDFAKIDPALAPYGAVNWDSLWDRNSISVCWLDHPEFIRERQLVREAVAQTWEAVSSVHFTEWRDCGSNGADVRVSVYDSTPNSYIGRYVLGQSPSAWLNFRFNSWKQECAAHPDDCIKAIAVHEFGHVLGFAHEQLRSDAPKECVNFLQSTGQWEQVNSPPVPLTPYDADSIMNYCNAIYYNHPGLSVNDVKAVQRLFPNQ